MIVIRNVIICVCVLMVTISYVECLRFGIHTPGVTANLSADSESTGDAGGGSDGGSGSGGFNVRIRGGFGVHGLLARILHVPASIIGRVGNLQYKYVFRLPLTLVTKGTARLSNLVQEIEDLDSNSLSEAMALVKQVIDNVVDGLVGAGVFQGKTAEQIMDSIQNVVTRVATKLMDTQNSFSAGVVSHLKELIDNLNIPEIRMRISNLPVIRDLVEFAGDIQMFIRNNFQTQIDDMKSLIQNELSKNKDFIQPISDAVSSRILIVINAAQALVNDDLTACPGDTSGAKSPTGSLQWQMNIFMDEFKLRVLKFLGLTDQAANVQSELDELKSEGASGSASGNASAGGSVSTGPTSLPPVLTTLSESASQTSENPPPISARSMTTPSPSLMGMTTSSSSETMTMTIPSSPLMGMTTPSPSETTMAMTIPSSSLMGMTTPSPSETTMAMTIPSSSLMGTTTPSPSTMAMTMPSSPESTMAMTTEPPMAENETINGLASINAESQPSQQMTESAPEETTTDSDEECVDEDDDYNGSTTTTKSSLS